MKLTLYYDGECPFCNRYADILALKNCFELNICDAREDLSWKRYGKDIKLDDGVIVVYEERLYQGIEALDLLLSICKYKGWFFSLQKTVFANRYLGVIVYSFFKLLRKIALYLKRVK